MHDRTAERQQVTVANKVEPSEQDLCRQVASLAEKVAEVYKSLGLSGEEARRRSLPFLRLAGEFEAIATGSVEGRAFREQLFRMSEDIANITRSALGPPHEAEQQLIRLGFVLARIKAKG